MAASNHTKSLPGREWLTLLIRRHRSSWLHRNYRTSLLLSVLLFLVALAADTLAGIYATEVASNSVTDVILSNIPVVDVDLLYVYGAMALILLIFFRLVIYPGHIAFVLDSLGLFFIIRAIFISATHVAIFPDHVVLDFQSKIILTLFGGDQQFFSGHTGVPFLMALIYWREEVWRYIFLAISVFLGIIVLLCNLHYTIDVLSAFFISYTIYHMALWLFPKEYAFFAQDEILTANTG